MLISMCTEKAASKFYLCPSVMPNNNSCMTGLSPLLVFSSSVYIPRYSAHLKANDECHTGQSMDVLPLYNVLLMSKFWEVFLLLDSFAICQLLKN